MTNYLLHKIKKAVIYDLAYNNSALYTCLKHYERGLLTWSECMEAAVVVLAQQNEEYFKALLKKKNTEVCSHMIIDEATIYEKV